MLNGFPQGSSDPDVLVASIERATADVSNEAISEAAQRFTSGIVTGQHKTFAPSVAEFCIEARRMAELIPLRGRVSLPAPTRYQPQPVPNERARMRLKMPMYTFATAMGRMDELAVANKAGMNAMIALAMSWGIDTPPELLDIPDAEAESQWRTARNRAWAEIERNPPPFMRGKAREILRDAA